MISHPIPIDLLRRILRCDQESGKLYWLPRTVDLFGDAGHSAAHSCAKWNSKHANREAFTCISGGRREGRIFRKSYRAHRVIWALVHGRWPEGEIDHINRDPSDNRIVNLRECSHAENLMNQSSTKGSTSRFVGVSFDAKRGKWSARINPKGKAICLGRFHNEEDAARAYDDAARIHFGEFASLNFPNIERSAA